MEEERTHVAVYRPSAMCVDELWITYGSARKKPPQVAAIILPSRSSCTGKVGQRPTCESAMERALSIHPWDAHQSGHPSSGTPQFRGNKELWGALGVPAVGCGGCACYVGMYVWLVESVPAMAAACVAGVSPVVLSASRCIADCSILDDGLSLPSKCVQLSSIPACIRGTALNGA